MGILVTSCHINSIEFRLFAATCICCPVAQDVVHQHVEWHSKQTLRDQGQRSRNLLRAFSALVTEACCCAVQVLLKTSTEGCKVVIFWRSHKSCQTMTAMTLKKSLELETRKSTAMTGPSRSTSSKIRSSISSATHSWQFSNANSWLVKHHGSQASQRT